MPRPLTALQRQWYRRLAAEGFRDIEVSASARDPGAVLDSGRFVDCGPGGHRPIDPNELAERSEYYARARSIVDKLHGLERRVFSLHADGVTFREIARRTGRRLDWVHTTVSRIRSREGVRDVRHVRDGGGTNTLLQMVQRMDDETLLEVFG